MTASPRPGQPDGQPRGKPRERQQGQPQEQPQGQEWQDWLRRQALQRHSKLSGAEALAVKKVRRALHSKTFPSAGELASRLYFAVMLFVIVAAPLIRGVLLWLAEVLPMPGDPLLAWAAVALVLVAACVLPVIAWYALPIRISLPELDLLFTSPLSRWRLLSGRVLRFFAVGIITAWLLAGAVLVARVMQGIDVLPMIWPAVLGGMTIGLLGVALMLLVQLSRGTAWQRLRAQAEQVDLVSTLVLTGDFASASARIGEPVTLGRNWRLRIDKAQKSSVWLFVRRDLMGIARTPLRSGMGLLGTLFATCFALLALSAQEPSVAATLGMIAQLLAFASMQPWVRGLRTAAEGAGAPPLLPFTTRGLLLRHLIVPGGCALLVSVIGALVANVLLWQASGAQVLSQLQLTMQVGVLKAVLAAAGISLIALVLRLHASLKGPLPERLLAPVPTPVGDASGINIVLWGADALVLAALAGAILFALYAFAPLVAVFVLGAVLGVLALLSESRLRRSRTF